MKKLTVDFIEKNGFVKQDTIHEDEFCYSDYSIPDQLVRLFIFFNYFEDGNTTYGVVLEDFELENVGEDELLMLLKVLPSAEV